MKFKSHQVILYQSENEYVVSFHTRSKVEINDLKAIIAKGRELSVEVKEHRNKRSLDANAYCFLLCQKIAEVIHNTKEFVYQRAIRQVGQFEILPIKNEAVERWIQNWGSKGLGWFSEVLDNSKLDGYKKVISYYGSSIYDVREMQILIDELIYQCKELDIETASPAEIKSLLDSWDKKTN